MSSPATYKIRFLDKQKEQADDKDIQPPPTLFVLVFGKQSSYGSFFSAEEIMIIEKENTSIYFTDSFIYTDDTVEIIKLKIKEAISKLVKELNDDIKLNEMYLFAEVDEIIYAETIQQMILTDNNGARIIPYAYAYNLLSNFADILRNLPQEESVPLELIIDLIFSKKPSISKRITKQIAQKKNFIKIDKKIAVINPYLEWNINEEIILKPLNRDSFMLFETFSTEKQIVDNTIYCCWSKFIKKDNLWYFPNKKNLTESEKKTLHASMQHADRLYDTVLENYNVPLFGITQFNITIQPVKTVKFPLFIIFKLFNTSADHPLIKYNPRKTLQKIDQQTNDIIEDDNNEKKIIYKLYSNGITKTDEKIPFLAKENINAFIMHRETKSLTIYTYKLKYKDNSYSIACQFHADGSVSIYSTYSYEYFTRPIQVDDVQEIVKLVLKPILHNIQNMVNSFYELNFSSLYDSNVAINELSYSSHLQNNYNKIFKEIKQNYKTNPLLYGLISKNKDSASTKINQLLYAKVSGNVSKNIGFPIVFNENQMTIMKINDLFYLNVMFIYLNAIFYTISVPSASLATKGQPIPAQMNTIFEDEQKAAAKMDIVEEDEKNDEESKIENDEESKIEKDEESKIENDEESKIEKDEESKIEKDDEEEDDEDDEEDDEDDEDDDEDDEDDDDVLKFLGGAGENEKNPLVAKMKQMIPYLFKDNEKNKDSKLKKYSRTCQNNEPLIITTEQKKQLKFVNKDDLLEYGRDNRGDPLYFTCPAYYCMKEGSEGPVSVQDIKDGKCGEIKNAEKAIFTDADLKNKTRGNKMVYKPYDSELFPGFNSSRLQNGFCSPCCFKKLGKKLINKKKECQNVEKINDTDVGADVGADADADVAADADVGADVGADVAAVVAADVGADVAAVVGADKEKGTDKSKQVPDNLYILGADQAAPIAPKRWAYLPDILQEFLNNSKSECIQDINTLNTGLSSTCLMRYGIEKSPNKSFIATIANMLFYKKTSSRIPSVEEMCEILSKNITMDDFMMAQNGNLFAVFSDTTTTPRNTSTTSDAGQPIRPRQVQDIKTIYKSKIFSDVDLTNKYIHTFILQLMQSFENFQAYLINPESHIDYTYLWDILCASNARFFENGMNLCILELNKDKNSVSLVCPTDYSSFSSRFDESKPTYFIVQYHDHYFEPIYIHKTDMSASKNVQNIHKYYTFNNNSLLFLKKTLEQVIIPTLQQCSPPKHDIHRLLFNKTFTVKTLIMNFVGQIVGAIGETKGNTIQGFIPCVPSAYPYPLSPLSPVMKMNFMNQIPTNTYENTISFYKNLNITFSQISNDKNKLIGVFIQEYDWFVPFSSAILKKNADESIAIELHSPHTIRINDIYTANLETQTSDTFDKERVIYSSLIRLETIFYNIFKNTMRNFIINSPEYESLQELCMKDSSNSYLKQLKDVKQKLRKMGEQIKFVSNMNMSAMEEIAANNTSLIYPNKNLLTNEDNFYFIKLSDELIRFKQIRQSFFNKKEFMLFRELDAELKLNQILILESQLLYNDKTYLRGIKTMHENIKDQYIRKTTYDNAALKTKEISYAELNDKDNADAPDVVQSCVSSQNNIESNYILKSKCLTIPSDFKEVQYDTAPYCGLQMIVDLILILHNEVVSIDSLRAQLIRLYNSLMTTENDFKQIVKILTTDRQNKLLVAQLKNKNITIDHIILDKNFYPVLFDMWLLLDHYKIPSIFISSVNIPEADKYDNKKMFICYQDDSNKYSFINVPAMYLNHLSFPVYRLIVNQKNNGQKNMDLPFEATNINKNNVLLPISTCSNQPAPFVSVINYVQSFVVPKNLYQVKAIKKTIKKRSSSSK